MTISFKEFLLTEKMNRNEAEKILGLSGNYTEEEMLKRHKSLIQKNHPDRGGSLELSKQLNSARDALKGLSRTSGRSGSVNWDEIHAKYQQLAKDVSADLQRKYQPQNFVDYFEEFFGKKFNHTMVGEGETNPYYTGFKSKFTSEDNSIAFEFGVSVYLTDVAHPKNDSLSSNPDISYNLGVIAYGYANRKKQKMAQRDWDYKNNHTVLTDPAKSFSPAKMKKIKAQKSDGKMKRADFQLAIQNELGGMRWNDGQYIFDLQDGSSAIIRRTVLMRIPMWDVSIGERTGKYGFKPTTNTRYKSLPETAETLDLFLKMKHLDAERAAFAYENHEPTQ